MAFCAVNQRTLNCQSEVAIFEVKKEKNPKLTLTKEYGIYIDISRFSEPEEAAIDKVGCGYGTI